jgi:hypothetical protein
MNNPKELKARYPYQFAGEQISMSYSRGWFHLFSHLCADIDEALGDEKRGFHWTQVKEKFGSARLYFSLPEEVREREPELMEQLMALKCATEAATQKRCAACGRPGWIDRSADWLLPLCEKHHQARFEDTLIDLWCGEDEQ